jgi:hydroxymethylbilane synthase
MTQSAHPGLQTGARLRLGTRGSPLALAQTALVEAGLAGAGSAPAALSRLVVETVGDRVQDRPLAEIGGKALWTRELDRALADGRIDAAVHSLKDVESPLASGLILAAVLERADVADRLVGAPSLAAMPAGARVGTSSPRRAAQLRHRRPDLAVAPLRGNVDTRLARVAEGAVAATFLAAAGLDRLGRPVGQRLDPEDWLPAASQGAIAIVARADDAAVIDRLRPLDHAPTRAAVLAERAFLEAVGGTCHSAIAAHATILAGGAIRLRAELYAPDGSRKVADAEQGAAGEAPAAVAERLARRLLRAAGPGFPGL